MSDNPTLADLASAAIEDARAELAGRTHPHSGPLRHSSVLALLVALDQRDTLASNAVAARALATAVLYATVDAIADPPGADADADAEAPGEPEISAAEALARIAAALLAAEAAGLELGIDSCWRARLAAAAATRAT